MKTETERLIGLDPHAGQPPRAGTRLYIYRYWILALLVAIAWFAWRRHGQMLAKTAVHGAAPPVPVGISVAASGDIPVYLDGLGAVTAFYTDNVHTRVDGQLMSVPVKEGQDVKEGDVLADIDPRPYKAQLDQAKGQLARDQALLADAKLDLERYKTLVAQNAIPKQQYDTQTALVGQDEGNISTDEAAVEAAQLQLVYAHITSPINGRMGLRLVDPGNIVHAADANAMFVITQLQPIALIFTLPEDNLPAVMKKVNAGAALIVEAYNRDKSQKLASGTLLTVDNQIDPNSGTVKLKAVFKNKENTLFPNQFVNARLLLETRHNQVIVPSVAVQSGSQGTYVYVVQQDHTVALRPIKVGIVEGSNTAIDAGLKPGDAVVVDGADKLQPGSSVTPQTPDGGSSPEQPGAPAKGAAPAHTANAPS